MECGSTSSISRSSNPLTCCHRLIGKVSSKECSPEPLLARPHCLGSTCRQVFGIWKFTSHGSNKGQSNFKMSPARSPPNTLVGLRAMPNSISTLLGHYTRRQPMLKQMLIGPSKLFLLATSNILIVLGWLTHRLCRAFTIRETYHDRFMSQPTQLTKSTWVKCFHERAVSRS